MDSLFDRHIEYLTEKDSALGFRLPVLIIMASLRLNRLLVDLQGDK